MEDFEVRIRHGKWACGRFPKRQEKFGYIMCFNIMWSMIIDMLSLWYWQGLVNVLFEHDPTLRDKISNRYLKVMFKISETEHLPTPEFNHNTWYIARLPRKDKIVHFSTSSIKAMHKASKGCPCLLSIKSSGLLETTKYHQALRLSGGQFRWKINIFSASWMPPCIGNWGPSCTPSSCASAAKTGHLANKEKCQPASGGWAAFFSYSSYR